MATSTAYEAKDFEVYGAGFGTLQLNGKAINLIQRFQDSGQPALGSAIDVIDINDQFPKAIIPPMAVSSGTLTLTTYALRKKGLFGSMLNGTFESATDLVDLFNLQIKQGSLQFVWVTLDESGNPTKAIAYDGVVVTNATRAITVDNAGAKQAQYTFTCKYTRQIEM
jgi:hypothetical protein